MANLTAADEALIAKFIGLNTKEQPNQIVKVTQSAASSTNWEKCLMAQVITDRTVQDGVFISTMLSAWRVDSGTTISPVMRNCYLVEFSEIEDMQRVQAGGAWTFRGDIVALRHVKSQTDLSPNHIGSVTLWVQFYNLPFNSLKDEGLEIMAKEIGTPVSPPVNGFYNGRRFVIFKIIIPLGVSLKDRVKLAHPTLGEITTHCVYEKATCICTYCGCIGHELVTCPDHARVTVIVHDPANSGKFNPAEILSLKKGAWITDPSLVPLDQDKSQVFTVIKGSIHKLAPQILVRPLTWQKAERLRT